MGVLRKIGGVILAYLILGVIMYFLLLNGVITYNDGNAVVDILYTIFYPIIWISNFIYMTLPFV